VIEIESNPMWISAGKKIAFIGKIHTGRDTQALYIPADKSNIKPADVKPLTGLPRFTNYINIGPGRDLWIINEDGTDLQQLTRLENCVRFKISPDGKKIVFIRNKIRHTAKTAVSGERLPPFCVLDVATKKTTILSTPKPPFINEQYGKKYGTDNKMYFSAMTFNELSWSPDSKSIAFSLHDDPDTDGNIWVIDVNGSNLRSINKSNQFNHNISHQEVGKSTNIRWWPDNKITFYRDNEDWLVNPDGTDLKHNDSQSDNHSSLGCWSKYWFSPDGSKVIFYDVNKEKDAKSRVHLSSGLYLKKTNNPQVQLVWKVSPYDISDLFWEE
jgi:Tol biopolymer transport system component